MKASDLLIRCLEQEDVRFIFGVPGEEVLDILNSLSSSNHTFFVTCRHEQGAAFMADVYGRFTGNAGVCLGTLGPGATNLLTGVADATLDRAPVVVLTGQIELRRMHKETHQFIDTLQLFKNVTKWNTRVTKAETIPEIMRKAFRIAETEKKGGTHIEIPHDVAREHVRISEEAPKERTREFAPQRPKFASVKKAGKTIEAAKNAIIIAGNGVIRAHASAELLEFASRTNIPVVTTFMGKGGFSANEELHIGTVGLQENDYVMCGIERADLVITVGMDFAEYSPERWNPKRQKKILHVDFEYPETDVHYVTHVNLMGDLKETLRLLCDQTGSQKDASYSFKLKHLIDEEFNSFRNDTSYPLKPQKIVYDLRSALHNEDVLLSDVGAHKLWLCRLYPVYRSNSFIVSNGFSSMGIALPGAIAVKLANLRIKVVAVTGDGGFLMNVQELETAKRLGLNFVVVIFNDQKYGAIEWKQLNRFQKAFGSSFTNPDFVKLAESFGVSGYRIEKAEELHPTLVNALNRRDITIIDTPVDFHENLQLTKKLGQFICPI